MPAFQDDSVLNDGVLNDGVLNDGVLNDGVLDDGVLEVTSRPVPPGLDVYVDGEVDADTTALLLSVLTRAVDESPLVRCDLGGVRFFGAAGVNALAAAGVHAAGLGHRLELSGASGLTRQILELSGLHRLLTMSG